MSEKFDHSFDVVVVGSGGAAMATALGAVDENLDVVMLESTDKWGGSTAMSGGGLWLPNNPLMQRERVADSRESAPRLSATAWSSCAPASTPTTTPSCPAGASGAPSR